MIFIKSTILALAFSVAAVQFAMAAEEWKQTMYFAPKYTPSEKIPAFDAGWTLQSQSLITLGDGVTKIQDLGGDSGLRTIWVTNDYVVDSAPDQEPTAFARRNGEEVYDVPGKPDLSWIKKLEPVGKTTFNNRQILVFDRVSSDGGNSQRWWIDQESSQVIAIADRIFITLFEPTPPPIVSPQMPADVLAAIKKFRKVHQEAANFGAMSTQ